MSPSGEDMLARQNLQSQGRTRGASLRALTMRSPSPQPTRFDPSALSRSMSEAGGLRSLPTQIRDRRGRWRCRPVGVSRRVLKEETCVVSALLMLTAGF